MDEPQGGARLAALLARDLCEMGQDVTLYCYGYDQARCFPDLLADVPVRCVRRLDGAPGPPRGYETGWGRSWAQLRRYYHEAPVLASLIDARTEIVNPHEWLAHRSAALFGLSRGVPSYGPTTIRATGTFQSGWGASGSCPLPCAWWFDTRQVNRFAAVTTLSRWMTQIGERAFTAPVQLVRCGIDARGDSRGARSRPRPQHRCVCASAPERRDSGRHGAPWRTRSAPLRSPGTPGVRVTMRSSARPILAVVRNPHTRARGRTGPGRRGQLAVRIGERGGTGRQHTRGRTLRCSRTSARRGAWRSLEAMVRGVPLVASRGAGVSEVLSDGGNRPAGRRSASRPDRPRDLTAGRCRAAPESPSRPRTAPWCTSPTRPCTTRADAGRVSQQCGQAPAGPYRVGRCLAPATDRWRSRVAGLAQRGRARGAREGVRIPAGAGDRVNANGLLLGLDIAQHDTVRRALGRTAAKHVQHSRA